MNYMCGICGKGFMNDLDAKDRKRKSYYGYGDNPYICIRCAELSYYEQCMLFLMRSLADRRHYRYCIELKQIQNALDSISEQLSKYREINIIIDDKEIAAKLLTT